MVDFTKLDPSSGETNLQDHYPPGEVILWCKGFARKKRRGNDQIDFVFIPVMTMDGEPIPENTYLAIFETCTLSDRAAWRVINLLQAVGQINPVNVYSDSELSAAVKFKPCRARIGRHSYQGNEKAEIKQWLKIPAELRKKALALLEDKATEQAMDGGGFGYNDEPDFRDSYGDEPATDGPDFSDDDIPF